MYILLQFCFPRVKYPEKSCLWCGWAWIFYVVEADLEHMILWPARITGLPLSWFLVFLFANCRAEEPYTAVVTVL